MFLDVQPIMGTTLRARARIQINLAVSQVTDIKQVASFPDIIFPIIWFEDVSIRNLVACAIIFKNFFFKTTKFCNLS